MEYIILFISKGILDFIEFWFQFNTNQIHRAQLTRASYTTGI